MKCIHCGKEITNVTIVDENDQPVCEKCFRNHYEYCNDCHRAIPRGQKYCNSCADRAFNRVMNSYSTKITSVFGNKKSDNIKCLNDRYYGLELEYNYFSPALARVLFKEQYNNKLIYNKSDSSISCGVEIVTIPLVKPRLLKLIDDLDVTRIKNTGSRDVTNGAGLHIHVSRNTISKQAVNKLSILFNSYWASPYKNYIYYLAGRVNQIYDSSHRVSDHYFQVGSTSLLESVMDYERMSFHSVALNLGNEHTVEFRLFKATTNPMQLKSYVEFTELAIQFAETQPIRLMTIPNFIVYLNLNATNEWLKKRLESLHEACPDLFEIKEKEFTYEYYMSKFKDMDELEMYNKIREINDNVHISNINWDVEKIDTDIITRWESSSLGMSIRDKKLLNGLLQEIKRRTVEKVLKK